MLQIAVIGTGRMGQAIMRGVAAADDLRLAGIGIRPQSSPGRADLAACAGSGGAPVVSSNPAEAIRGADVVIDFSLPTATAGVVAAAVQAQIPLVCGVSGLGPDLLASLDDASAVIPVLYDRNMSIGIAVMTQLVEHAARIFGRDFRAEIHESHHVHKLDAPSGTALQLGEALAHARGQAFDTACHYDADGSKGPAAPDAIVFRVTREGENPGEHTVLFAGDNETLSLTHKVGSRQVFADGALRAARWLVRQRPGRYCIADIADDAAIGAGACGRA